MKNQAWVYTDLKHGWVSVTETEFRDMHYASAHFEESSYGDVMHFEYAGEVYSSNVVFGSKPGE